MRKLHLEAEHEPGLKGHTNIYSNPNTVVVLEMSGALVCDLHWGVSDFRSE